MDQDQIEPVERYVEGGDTKKPAAVIDPKQGREPWSGAPERHEHGKIDDQGQRDASGLESRPATPGDQLAESLGNAQPGEQLGGKKDGVNDAVDAVVRRSQFTGEGDRHDVAGPRQAGLGRQMHHGPARGTCRYV
jgi:hypothetical protein